MSANYFAFLKKLTAGCLCRAADHRKGEYLKTLTYDATSQTLPEIVSVGAGFGGLFLIPE